MGHGDQEPETFDLFGNPSALPATVRRVITASAEISQEPPDRADFLHAILCQVGMPRKATEGRIFERTSGNASMVLEAGKLWTGNPGSIPLTSELQIQLDVGSPIVAPEHIVFPKALAASKNRRVPATSARDSAASRIAPLRTTLSTIMVPPTRVRRSAQRR